MWIASEFKPHFELAAKSWAKVEQDNRNQHFFATLDFDEARDVFRRVSSRSRGGRSWKLTSVFLSSWDWCLHQLCICTLLPKAHAGQQMAKLNPKSSTSRRSTCHFSPSKLMYSSYVHSVALMLNRSLNKYPRQHPFPFLTLHLPTMAQLSR